MPNCAKCGAEFKATKRHSQTCLACKRSYDARWRARRKSEGNPVMPTKMPLEYHREYGKKYYAQERVRARRNAAARSRYRDPNHAQRIRAREEVRRAIRRGTLTRQPCEVCGCERVQAHHDDYSEPLEVRWLCLPHHVAVHSKAEGRS